MDEIHFAEAVFRIIKERRQGVQDLVIYDNVKNIEQYRELMGNLKSPRSRRTGTQGPAR